MKFIEERKLREAFWNKYGHRKNILGYQFENKSRTGGIDLLTVELVATKEKEYIQFVGFEFKLDDIKKAIAQAEENTNYVHKSFIVIPAEKKNLIEDKYMSYLKICKYVGVIGVQLNGTWEIIYAPWSKKDEELTINQDILKVAMNLL